MSVQNSFWDWLSELSPHTWTALVIILVILYQTGLGRGLFEVSQIFLRNLIGVLGAFWQWVAVIGIVIMLWLTA